MASVPVRVQEEATTAFVPQAWACSPTSYLQESDLADHRALPRCWPVRDAEPQPQWKTPMRLRNIESPLLCLESPSLP